MASPRRRDEALPDQGGDQVPDRPSWAILSLLLVLGAVVVVVGLSILSNPVAADSPPPASGDWTVASDTTVSNSTVNLTDGNLTIDPGVTLTLDNVTVYVNETEDEARYIWINGSLEAINSTIAAEDPVSNDTIPILVDGAGNITLEGCHLSGLASSTSPMIVGLRVEGAATIARTNISDGYGLTLYGPDPVVEDLILWNTSGHCLSMRYEGIDVSGIRAYYPAYGVRVGAVNCTVRDVVVVGSELYGISVESWGAWIDNATISGSWGHAIYSHVGGDPSGYDVRISNSSISDQVGRAEVITGIYCSDDAVRYEISNTTVSGCQIGIRIQEAYISIDDCTVSGCGAGLYLDGALGVWVNGSTVSGCSIGCQNAGSTATMAFRGNVWARNNLHAADMSYYGTATTTWTGDTFRAGTGSLDYDFWLEAHTWEFSGCSFTSSRSSVWYAYNGTIWVSNSTVSNAGRILTNVSGGDALLVLDNSTHTRRAWAGNVSVRWSLRVIVERAGSPVSGATVTVANGTTTYGAGTTDSRGALLVCHIPEAELLTITANDTATSVSTQLTLDGFAEVTLSLSVCTWSLGTGYSSVALVVTPAAPLRASDLLDTYDNVGGIFWRTGGRWVGLTRYGGTDTILRPGVGYMVQTSAPVTISIPGSSWTGQISVSPGGALVPLPGLSGLRASQVLAQLEPASSLGDWGGSAGWRVYLPGSADVVDWTVTDGTAYWVSTSASIVYPPNGA